MIGPAPNVDRLMGRATATLAALVGIPLLLARTPGPLYWWAAALAILVPVALLARRWPTESWWATVATVALSFEVATGIGMSRIELPFEALLLVVTFAFAERCWHKRSTLEAIPWRHPVLWLSAASLGWLAITALLAVTPAVGAKLTLARLVHAVAGLGIGLLVLRRPRDLRTLAFVANLALAPVVLIALARIAHAGFSHSAVYTATAPFFPNRLEFTVFAAVWLVAGSAGPPSPQSRVLWRWSLAAPAVALVLLQGRAGLLAAAVGLIVRAVVTTQPRPAAFVVVLLLTGTGFGTLAIDASRWWDQRNSSVALDGPLDGVWRAGFEALLLPDESTMERLNRWRCAVLMAKSRPVVGFGPGSFEPTYGPYQRPSDLTSASTFAGDRGDAHSQPLGTLAEQGLVGLALECLLLGAGLMAGLRAARRASNAADIAIAAAWTGALAGLVVAGLFVGWSDLPETGSAAWLVLAALVRLDSSRSDEETGGLTGCLLASPTTA